MDNGDPPMLHVIPSTSPERLIGAGDSVGVLMVGVKVDISDIGEDVGF